MSAILSTSLSVLTENRSIGWTTAMQILVPLQSRNVMWTEKSQMSDTITPIPFLAGSETMPPVFLSADLPFQNKTASLPEIL